MSPKLLETGLPSKKQKAVLDFIHKFLSKKGHLPSRREVADGLGLSSPATVQQHIEALQAKGLLNFEDLKGSSPSIESPTSLGRGQKPHAGTADVIELPVLGRVAAGYPIEAIETRNNTLMVPSSILGRGEHFVLQVTGQSMIEDGIFEGDFVVVRKAQEAKNGETVIAMVENEATIKRFFRKKSFIELHPANPNFSVIQVDSEKDFRIEGILVSLIRKYS